MDRKEIERKITNLKEKNDIIILAHNYQSPEVQDIADFLGDSLDLALKATRTDAENIVFCGVDFMAESSKILNPNKNVIHPDVDAKCPMAGMVDAESLGWLIKDNPDAEVVSYINTTAEVKAITDICCTSANGEKVVRASSAEKIIFVPDRNLGLYIQRFVPEKEMILWPGICPTHHKIQKEEILNIKKKHPKAEIMVHPECRPEIIDLADHVFSTSGMVRYSKKSDTKEFIIGTEIDMCYRLKKESPKKTFYSLSSAVCPNMKKITLQKVLKSVESLEPKIDLSKDVMQKAKMPLQKMMDIGRGD
jgi:quinolinate synthase